MIGEGHRLDVVLKTIGRAESTYREWLKVDQKFQRDVRSIREIQKRTNPKEVPDFPEFCSTYLGTPLYNHQLQWMDLLAGDRPRNLHPSQIYEPGDPRYILINTAPEHGKTSTLSINYATWSIIKNPNERIMLVSKTQDMAKQFLYAIKQRLTHPNYLKLQLDFGPAQGWKADADAWKTDQIYLGSERDGREADPTVQALGIGGQTYGRRVTKIFVDDAVVLSNAHEYEKQLRWIQQEVLTRLGPTGILIVVGTRVDPIDLYSELRNPERYPSGESPWTYLTQPAVLEFAEESKDWVTLWPRAQEPWPGSFDLPDADGLFPRWDGGYLRRRRNVLSPRTWALAYMQQSIAEDAVFSPEVVRKCVNGRRQPGIMTAGAVGHREKGMDGLYVVGSMDPAMVGDTGVIVLAVDRHAKKRYVLSVDKQPRATPAWIRQRIKDLTEMYGIHDWVIERNAFQAFLTQDPELQEWLGALGVRIHEHHTGKGKWSVDFGVASLAPVFEQGLMELPATHVSEACKALVEQLITWAPETKNKTDLVMALWFADLRARELIEANSPAKGRVNFLPNRWLSRKGRDQQLVVNLNDLAMSQRRGMNGVNVA